jgi:hypothetical protein
MNTTAEEVRVAHADHNDGHEHCDTVTIHVNNEAVFLHPGDYAVATLKKLAGVPLADDLDELVECQLKPVPDDAMLHIRGCEIFVSHVKDGGSS